MFGGKNDDAIAAKIVETLLPEQEFSLGVDKCETHGVHAGPVLNEVINVVII